MRWDARRRQFGALLAGNSCVYPASVFDAVSARMAEDLEFECGLVAGSVASLTVLGAPDHVVLTLSELVAQARRICRGSTLPVLVDADHGYGNALNVMRTVEELEMAGVAGLSIEDTALPRRFNQDGQASLVPVEEGVGKIKAAVAARDSSHLVIAARTNVTAMGGTDEAAHRIRAYQDSGADALFLIGVRQAPQLEALARVAELPLILGGASQTVGDRDYLASCGVRICLQGHQPIMAAYQAVYDTLKALRAGEKPGSLLRIPDSSWLARYTRETVYAHWIDQYLK